MDDTESLAMVLERIEERAAEREERTRKLEMKMEERRSEREDKREERVFNMIAAMLQNNMGNRPYPGLYHQSQLSGAFALPATSHTRYINIPPTS